MPISASFRAHPEEFGEAIARYASLALSGIHQEYPNKIAHVLTGPEDAKPPSLLTPAFYGCFDHHSAVHSHWMLARLARLWPDASYAEAARRALSRSLTEQNLRAELAYMSAPGRAGFERPYGLAWMLQLGAELRQWAQNDPSISNWVAFFGPLEQHARKQLMAWLPKLLRPMRVGEHSQTAFALGLAHDWTIEVGDEAFRTLIEERACTYFSNDYDLPIRFEPGGEDFVSASLGEADLMRRVLPSDQFADWLARALPTISRTSDPIWLAPGVVSDRSDGKLAHTDGLNLSRAWMMEGIASALSADDPRRDSLMTAANQHAELTLPDVTGAHYEGGHWLGTFAVYLITGRGLGPGAELVI